MKDTADKKTLVKCVVQERDMKTTRPRLAKQASLAAGRELDLLAQTVAAL